MKYVMFRIDSGDSHTHVPVIFADVFSHAHMAEAVEMSWLLDHTGGAPSRPPVAVSAGFLDINCTVDMSRLSETLSIGPHKDDQLRINTWRHTFGQF